MTVEEEKAHTEMISDLQEGAQWIGEDGAMCALAANKRKALSMMKSRIREDVGDYEARELEYSDISEGWARVATQSEIDNDGNGSSWFVHYKKPEVGNVVKVYVYRT